MFIQIGYKQTLCRAMPAIVAIGILLLSGTALGHDEPGGGASFASGLLHPALGFDHLLAMLSVGIISVQIGGLAIWYVPGTFVAVMVLGGYLGMNGVPVPAVESGIAVSVLVLGAAIMIGRMVPVLIALGCVVVFAIYHGHAHGAEMPLIADPLKYGLGFVLGTAIIHLTGVALGFLARKAKNGRISLRIGGGIISAVGAYFLISIFLG